MPFSIKTKDEIPPPPFYIFSYFFADGNFFVGKFCLSFIPASQAATTSPPAKCSKESYTRMNLLYPVAIETF